MKITIVFLALLFPCLIGAQNKVNSKGSKLFFYNKNIGALIKENRTVAITSNGAKSWKQIEIDSGLELSKVLFTSETVGWLLSKESIFKTVDGGNTWEENKTFVGSYLRTIYFINDELGFIGGRDSEENESLSVIYKTSNGGQSWVKTSIDTNFTSDVIDFSFANDSVGIAISDFTLYKTEDGGNNWIGLPIQFYVGSKSPVSGKMIDNENIVLVEWYALVVAEGRLRLSQDAGITWKDYGNGQSFRWGVDDSFISNKDSVWLSTGVFTYFTGNGGLSWDTLNIQINLFSFFPNKQAYGLSGNKIIYTDDGWQTHSIIDSTITSVSAVKTEEIPQTIILHQNYPNPFNPVTTIAFEIAKKERVEINIYNILCEKITTLLAKDLDSGYHEIVFNADGLPSGIYFYQIKTLDSQLAKKCILLK